MMMQIEAGKYGGLVLFASAMALSLTAVGCGGGELECQTSQDCFMGQYCVQGFCQDDPPMVTVNNGTAGNNQTPNNQSTNNQVSNNQTAGNNQTTTGNMSSNRTTPMPVGVCRVDPFNAPECMLTEEERTDEPNETSGFEASNFFENNRTGCYTGSLDTYKSISHTKTRMLCGFENADWYRQTIETCDNRDFVATFTLTPKKGCLPEEVRFRIEEVFDSETADVDCADPRLDCQQTENGGWIIKMLFPRQYDENEQLVENYRERVTWFFAVSSPYDAQFEYDLTVETPMLDGGTP